jgi:hypothetical protein
MQYEKRRMVAKARGLKKIAPAPPRRIPSSPKVTKRPRIPRTPKRTPNAAALDSFDSSFQSSPKPRITIEKHEDVNYDAIEDFCPPLDSLNGNTKGLKAEWKGQDLYLGDDPDRHLLLPAEVQMASALRLTCAQYLTTKRRIFKAKVELLREGIASFKKTNAQKAGHIDVNKASRLWMAYDRVGWFDTKYFTQFI